MRLKRSRNFKSKSFDTEQKERLSTFFLRKEFMKKLKKILRKNSGRRKGTVRVRHQGGREKRFLRIIDFKRDKKDVSGFVSALEYDPNRNCDVALVVYTDGEKRYILAPVGLREGMKVLSSESASVKVGNNLPLAKMPVGTTVHNIEIRAGKGGQMVRGAGSGAVIQGREEDYILVKLPSAEIRRYNPNCWATVGQVGKVEMKTRRIKNAGAKRHMGVRPTVRGIAQHPGSHPHGGGEGRSGVGMKHPKTPYGRAAVGKTRRKKKYSDKLLVKERKRGKSSTSK